MSEPENITQFKEMAGRILGHLYAIHPKAAQFNPDCFFDEPLEGDEADLFDDTGMYLLENGYLFETQTGIIRLRDRGYEVLNQPNPLQPKETLGSSLAGWAKSAASTATKSGISELTASVLKALFAAVTPSP